MTLTPLAPPATSPTRPTDCWEYLVEFIFPVTQDALNARGAAGWEFVYGQPCPPDGLRCVFKRRVRAGAEEGRGMADRRCINCDDPVWTAAADRCRRCQTYWQHGHRERPVGAPVAPPYGSPA